MATERQAAAFALILLAADGVLPKTDVPRAATRLGITEADLRYGWDRYRPDRRQRITTFEADHGGALPAVVDPTAPATELVLIIRPSGNGCFLTVPTASLPAETAP